MAIDPESTTRVPANTMGGRVKAAMSAIRAPAKSPAPLLRKAQGMKKGGAVRGDGCCMKGKTKGRMC